MNDDSLLNQVIPRWYQKKRPIFFGNNQVSLLHSGTAYFEALQQSITQAREEILFESYIFSSDAAAQKIAEALIRAADRGVHVSVLVDGFGSAQSLTTLERWFQPTPVSWRAFRPLTDWWHWLTRSTLRRLHRKLVVIDNMVAYIGGINIIDDHQDLNHGTLEHPRLDFAVAVRGDFARVAAQALRRDSKKFRPHLDIRPTRQPVRVALVLRDNFRQRRAIEKSYLQAIAHARHDIILANAYFFPGARFRRALRHAAQRGVKVTLILQGRPEYPLQHYATQAMYDELLDSGIHIFEYEKSFLHAKVAVVDDEWATVGSSNIDPFSLLLAYEANAIILDETFTTELRLALQKIIEESKAITPAQHAQRGWITRLVHRGAMALLRCGVSLSGEHKV